MLEVAEAFAEGNATFDELSDARDEVDMVRCTEAANLLPAANAAAEEAVFWLSTDEYKVSRSLEYVIDAAGYLQAVSAGILPAKATLKAAQVVWQHPAFLHGKEEEGKALCDLIRDVVGNPFRPPPPISPSILQWNAGTVKRLAEQAYQERSLPSGHLDPERLAVLADALEEAGVPDPDILGHLRQQGAVHVRGCWLVDLVLGKS